MCILDDIRPAVAKRNMREISRIVFTLRCNNFGYDAIAGFFFEYSEIDPADFDELLREAEAHSPACRL